MIYEPSLLDEILGDLKDDPDYLAETMSLRVIEDALAFMESAGMTKARLADAMNVSRAYVTKLFNAPPNLTLRTIAQLALAVGARATLRLEPIGGAMVPRNCVVPGMPMDHGSNATGVLTNDVRGIVPGSYPASADWSPVTAPMPSSCLQFSTLNAEDLWKYPMSSNPISVRNVDSSPIGSAKSTGNISTTASTTIAPSMAA